MLALLAGGKVYKQIAAELQITESTVRSHCNSIYGKLEVYNAAQAVAKLAGGQVDLKVKVRRPPPPTPRMERSLASTAPLLHAYLKLWEAEGCPVPHLVDLDYDEIPSQRRRAMHVLLAMHMRLREE